MKILVEFEGNFVWRNSKLIHIGKLDNKRRALIAPFVPHPNLTYIYIPMQPFTTLPQVVLSITPKKSYVISIWFNIFEGDEPTCHLDVILEFENNIGAPMIEYFGDF